MLKVYGSTMCPDCRACKANFEANGIEFEFIDINENLHNLAEFLKLRDSEPVFDKWKKVGDHLHMDNELFSFDLAYESSGKLILIETGEDASFNTVMTKK